VRYPVLKRKYRIPSTKNVTEWDKQQEINTQDAKKVLRTAERAIGSGVIFRGDNWHSFWQGGFIIQKNEVMEWNVSHKYSILSLREEGECWWVGRNTCQQSRNKCSAFSCWICSILILDLFNGA